MNLTLRPGVPVFRRTDCGHDRAKMCVDRLLDGLLHGVGVVLGDGEQGGEKISDSRGTTSS